MSPDPVAEAYERSRERLGALGVSLPWFCKEVAAALDGAAADTLGSRLVVDDLYLALGCRVGNGHAWRLFDRAYRGYLLRLATRYAGSRDAAEHLITDLYHDLVTRPGREGKLDHYKGYAALATWLAVIVRRMAFDRGRKAERRGHRLRRLEKEQQVRPRRPNPEQAVRAAETRRVAGELFGLAFSALEGRHALVLTLLYRDGLTLREAGKVMKLDFSTVSRRAKAARRALRAVMERLGEERLGLSTEDVAAVFAEGADAASFSEAGGAA